VEFGNVKMFLNSKIYKDHFVSMKCGEAPLQLANGLTCMRLVLSKKQEIKECTNCSHEVRQIYPPSKWEINNEPKKDRTHPLVLLA